MNRSIILSSMLALAFAGSVAVGHAQTATPPPAPAKTVPADKGATKAPPAPAKPTEPTRARMHEGHGAKGGGKGMMGGQGMMGGHGMMGDCPMMAGADTKVEVKNLPKGVSVTYTSEDADAVARLQKMAETMQKKHEARHH